MLFTPAERRLLTLLALLLSSGFALTALRQVGCLPGLPEGAANDRGQRDARVRPVVAELASGPVVRVAAHTPFVDGYLDVNRADSLDLVALPGIGPALAGRILVFRRERGRVDAVDELREVNGIGEKRLADLKRYVVAR